MSETTNDRLVTLPNRTELLARMPLDSGQAHLQSGGCTEPCASCQQAPVTTEELVALIDERDRWKIEYNDLVSQVPRGVLNQINGVPRG